MGLIKRISLAREKSPAGRSDPAAAGGASEEHECSFFLTDGALAEWVALQELGVEVASREKSQNLRKVGPDLRAGRSYGANP